MRRVIFCILLLCATLAMKAQKINGFRVDGGNTPILVYFGGNQMCLPTTSCFVANLEQGYYTIEVYETRFTRPGERVWKGRKLYDERIYFTGTGVRDIFVEDRDNTSRPIRPGQDDYRPDNDHYNRVMSNQLFNKFLQKIKNEPFDRDRTSLLNAALANSDFTSEQCLQIVKLYSFDSERKKIMKQMYPRIIDKQAFFLVINTLTFSNDKREIEEFMQGYSNRR